MPTPFSINIMRSQTTALIDAVICGLSTSLDTSVVVAAVVFIVN